MPGFGARGSSSTAEHPGVREDRSRASTDGLPGKRRVGHLEGDTEDRSVHFSTRLRDNTGTIEYESLLVDRLQVWDCRQKANHAPWRSEAGWERLCGCGSPLKDPNGSIKKCMIVLIGRRLGDQ
jgi:hypothetical protein